MSDPSSQNPQGFHLLSLSELGFHESLVLFGLLALSDIKGGPPESEELTFRADNGNPRNIEPYPAAGPVSEAAFHIVESRFRMNTLDESSFMSVFAHTFCP